MSYMASALFHNALTSRRVLVSTSIVTSHLPVSILPDMVSHGGGLVTLYRCFSTAEEAQRYQAYIQRTYTAHHARLPPRYVQAVLSLYSGPGPLPSVSGQLSLF